MTHWTDGDFCGHQCPACLYSTCGMTELGRAKQRARAEADAEALRSLCEHDIFGVSTWMHARLLIAKAEREERWRRSPPWWLRVWRKIRRRRGVAPPQQPKETT